MNPACSFGPALASRTWHDLSIYLAEPPIEATIGVFAYQLVRQPNPLATAGGNTEGETLDGDRPVRLPA